MRRNVQLWFATISTVTLSACGSSRSASVPIEDQAATTAATPGVATTPAEELAETTTVPETIGPTPATVATGATSAPTDEPVATVTIDELLDIADERNRAAHNSDEIHAVQQSHLRAVDESKLPGLLSTSDVLRARVIDPTLSGRTFRAFGSVVFEDGAASVCIARNDELALSCQFRAPIRLEGRALGLAMADAGAFPDGVLETHTVALDGYLDPSDRATPIVVTAFDQGSGLAGPPTSVFDGRSGNGDCDGEAVAFALSVLLGDDGRQVTTVENEGTTVSLFVVFPLTDAELESVAAALDCPVQMQVVLGLT